MFSVPPLEGFVMNRVLGDYFETLLYKIFVSIDEHTTVSEVSVTLVITHLNITDSFSLTFQLAGVLQIDLQLVKVRTHVHKCIFVVFRLIIKM